MSSVSQIYLAEISDTKRRLVLAKKRKTNNFFIKLYFVQILFQKGKNNDYKLLIHFFYFFLEEHNRLSISRDTC
jgi:hypothetical protein